ncbi:MAG: histidinol dehydrogenase [Cyclobacteriaceae bacterium]|nr:MAG: histidinol dehydrogenase [Cyclobacteriaceae bacterium]
MQLIQNPPVNVWGQMTERPLQTQDKLESTVREIIETVRKGGDAALEMYTEKFDGVSGLPLRIDVPQQEADISDALKLSIRTAYQNIKTFHESQVEPSVWVETMPGVRCCRRSTPIEKVGLYIPGGSAPLFSTLLMLAIPAKLAGCKQIVVCTPAQSDGSIHPAIIYCAQLLDIACIYPVGGAQAIAAMAYGTVSVPKVFKILGPGNQYVTMAKQLVSMEVAIDFPAGPSEVAILADNQANPDFIAADLLSQAEHGADSQVLLVTDAMELIQKVKLSLDKQLKALPRKEIASQALEQSKMVVFEDLDTGMEFLNTYAPEHLILNVERPEQWIVRVSNAGSVFLGAFTPESAGDYASGTNHTLPTNGNARMFAGVSLDTFVKKITYQEITADGIENLGDTIEVMARAEGLEAHGRAVSIRREYNKQAQ